MTTQKPSTADQHTIYRKWICGLHIITANIPTELVSLLKPSSVVTGALLIFYLIKGLNYGIAWGSQGSPLLQDFGFYQRAMQDALDGVDPYRIRDIGTAFLYPPPSLFIVEVFSYVTPFITRSSFFIVVNIALLLLMIIGIAKHYQYSVESIWYWFPLALGFAPWYEMLWQGQINFITEFGLFMLFLGETSFPVFASSLSENP